MLGLLVPSDPRWVERAAADVPRVLVDHAHCEMKAASNALALSAKCCAMPRVMRTLVEIAEEELRHFRQVLDELGRRGIELSPPEEDWYAGELRRRVAASRHRHDLREHVLLDGMLVGALIEARSCERFKLLAASLRDTDGDLAAFYDELFAAEARHHRVFVELGEEVSGDAELTRRRLSEVASLEAEVVRALPVTATMHG